jgi:hypothetical protein
MTTLYRDRLVIVWLLLIAVTLLSSMIGGADGLAKASGGILVTIAVLAIAFLKVAAVMFTYMDVRGAPPALKVACVVWLVVVFSVLTATYMGAF